MLRRGRNLALSGPPDTKMEELITPEDKILSCGGSPIRFLRGGCFSSGWLLLTSLRRHHSLPGEAMPLEP